MHIIKVLKINDITEFFVPILLEYQIKLALLVEQMQQDWTNATRWRKMLA